jgi:uncharacterized protein (TIGR02231 family)
MKIFIAALCMILFCSLQAKVKLLSTIGPITKATLFKDRAYVTRESSLALKQGNYTIAFPKVTPLVDLDSIKVNVSNHLNLKIVGVRSKQIFTLQTSNNKLNLLIKKRERLENQINAISKSVVNLLKEQYSLNDISRHFKESFPINLHTRNWSKASFNQFVVFLSKRSRMMHGKWKRHYLNYQKAYSNLEFTNNKISELTSISDKHTYTIFIDLIAKRFTNTTLGLQYLVTHVGWNPTYDIRIRSGGRSKRAILEFHANIWQDTGEDWKDIRLTLSNFFQELNPQVPYLSTYTLYGKEVDKVKTKVISTTQNNKIGKAQTPVSQGVFDSDLAKEFIIPQRVSILSGLPTTKIFIKKSPISYKEHNELVAAQFPYIFRKSTLTNNFPWKLNTGLASIYYNLKFVGKVPLPAVPKGKEFSLNTGIDYGLKVYRSFKNEDHDGNMLSGRKSYTRIFSILVKNYSKYSKHVKVLEQIPISEIETVKISLEDSKNKSSKLANQKSWIYWNLILPPNSERSLKYSIKVEAPKDFAFNW